MKTPAINPPNTPPSGAEAPKEAKLTFLSLLGGQVMVIMATALGMIRAPPIPESARMALKLAKLEQKPVAMGKKTSIAPPKRKVFWRPWTAPRRPLIKTKVPWAILGESELQTLNIKSGAVKLRYEE